MPKQRDMKAQDMQELYVELAHYWVFAIFLAYLYRGQLPRWYQSFSRYYESLVVDDVDHEEAWANSGPKQRMPVSA